MKPWPKKNKIPSQSELIFPLKNLLLSFYSVKRRKVPNKDYKYNGYNFGPQELKNLPELTKFFSDDSVAYYKAIGFSVLDMILCSVYLMGVESGRREVKGEKTPMTMEVMMKLVEKKVNQIDELKKLLSESKSNDGIW